jgi:ribosomal protein L11 methyltransferase
MTHSSPPDETAWWEVQVELGAEAAELVGVAMTEVAGGVETRDQATLIRSGAERDRVVLIAMAAPDDRGALLDAIEEACDSAREAGLRVDPVVRRERLAHEDEWRDVWKQFFKPTRVGARFLVRPSWDQGTALEADLLIDIDPGRAFGTGGHASTRLVMMLSEKIAAARPPVLRFLDLGCGSGILSIAAARLWPGATGLAVDLDPEAAACSDENLALNHVGSVVTRAGTLEDVATTPPFDLILANIQADVLIHLAAGLRDHLAAGGTLVLSGLLTTDVVAVLPRYEGAGFRLVERRDEGEWAALWLGLSP